MAKPAKDKQPKTKPPKGKDAQPEQPEGEGQDESGADPRELLHDEQAEPERWRELR
jgi:hypothetical protein